MVSITSYFGSSVLDFCRKGWVSFPWPSCVPPHRMFGRYCPYHLSWRLTKGALVGKTRSAHSLYNTTVQNNFSLFCAQYEHYARVAEGDISGQYVFWPVNTRFAVPLNKPSRNEPIQNLLWSPDAKQTDAGIPLNKRSPKCGAPPGGGRCWSWGLRVHCMKDILILNEIWEEDKIYIVIGIFLG